MKRLHTNCLPPLQDNLFQIVKGNLNIAHINVGNIYRKIDDIKQDEIFQNSNIISLNETHLAKTDVLSPDMINLTDKMEIFCNDRNIFGWGVSLIVLKKFNPHSIHIDTCYEICAVMMFYKCEIVLISAYRPPLTSICQFTNEMSKVLLLFDGMNVCVMRDFNEDVFMSQSRTCCMMFKSKGYKQLVNKPTRDSGTLIDHIYATNGLHLATDVCDCYYSDHIYVLCTMKE